MRLDHLLSKEHTPRRRANVLARMVVFTSGIVDSPASLLEGLVSGTLLGPEGSAVMVVSSGLLGGSCCGRGGVLLGGVVV